VAPVHIVESKSGGLQSSPETHKFDVKKYGGIEDIGEPGEHPDVNTQYVCRDISWGGLVDHKSSFAWEHRRSNGLIGWEERLRNRGFQSSGDQR